MTECASYSYAVVAELHERNKQLQARLDNVRLGIDVGNTVEGTNLSVSLANKTVSPNQSNTADVQKEAEEVGFLAMGGLNQSTDNQYGKFAPPGHCT